jgi:16S rRNA G527 N7-methylase RsmG
MIASPLRELNGLRVSRETSERLEHFASLFLKWAKSINLVAPSTLGTIWQRHIADSAQIFQLLPSPKRWVDLGSGGGFPGIITAIFLADLDDAFFHKGRDYQQEIDNAVSRFQFDLVKHASVVEPDSVVLEIANLSRKIQ